MAGKEGIDTIHLLFNATFELIKEHNEQIKKYDELKEKNNKLRQEIDRSEAIVERSNRDFSDVKDSLPETLPNNFKP